MDFACWTLDFGFLDVGLWIVDFGCCLLDFDNNAPGADMDMMTCDAVLDHPAMRYEYKIGRASCRERV